jgi:uncharacterized protein YwlG (UPF0340 family)
MDVQYVFSSLESLADWLDKQALKEETTKPRSKKDEHAARGAAYAFRSAAHVVRSCKIEERQNATQDKQQQSVLPDSGKQGSEQG